MSRLFALALLYTCLLLTGCATPYQPNGLGGGYSELQLNKDTYQINFRGNEFTPKDQVNGYLLTRAAELTKQNGHRYFTVLGFNENAGVRYETTPTVVNASTNSSYNGWGSSYGRNYGSNYTYNGMGTSYGNATITPGQTYTRTHYNNSVLIKIFSNAHQNQSALDADTILKSHIKEQN